MICPWQQDYQDAKRVATQLGIPFKVYDFQKEYRQKVVDYMIDEYKAGRTPNPDIMCNQEVKFKLFLETALEDGADMIATGHYARILPFKDEPRGGDPGGTPVARNAVSTVGEGWSDRTPRLNQRFGLYAGVDPEKDQSYFLCRVTDDALAKSLMPIGEFTKPQVRQLARKYGLATADKKDSQGICFVGKVGIKDFLQQFVKSKPGKIINQNGDVVGEHDGALFYTIGQRQGLGIGGGLPYYVVGKDMGNNEVYVTTDLQDSRLWSNEIVLTSPHWINQPPQKNQTYTARTRYRADLHNISSIRQLEKGSWHLVLHDEVRALTPGQSTVIYQNDRVVGSGVVAKIKT